MFSMGHLIWIGLSVALIVGGYVACRIIRPPIERLLRACLYVGIASEAIKIPSVMKILPLVQPTVVDGALTSVPTGQYSPHLEMAHLPLELCSLMIFFILLALIIRDRTLRSSAGMASGARLSRGR